MLKTYLKYLILESSYCVVTTDTDLLAAAKAQSQTCEGRLLGNARLLLRPLHHVSDPAGALRNANAPVIGAQAAGGAHRLAALIADDQSGVGGSAAGDKEDAFNFRTLFMVIQ